MSAAKIIDPWGLGLVEDFHLEPFGLDHYPKPNRLMRRGVVFSGVGQKPVIDAIKNKKPFYVLSGIMPTADRIHLGNKMVVENIAYFQKHGGHATILVADLEAQATRGISLEEGQKRALQFHIPAYLALGLDPKKTTFYFQSENVEVMNAAYNYSRKVTLNQFKALYGAADPGRILAAVTQVADILYPQFKKRMPGVIPVGPDQLPHVLLARDIVGRMKSEKFIPPAAVFHKYTPSLDGSVKMSKSKPESMIELPEDIDVVCKKIKRAVSGGRKTLEEHRKKGAIIEQDMAFELLKQHLVEDDTELDRIYKEYKSGRMTSGEVKDIACEAVTLFMNDFEKKIKEARKLVPSLRFVGR
jgi:tryptophanyl-tRNA synthetase